MKKDERIRMKKIIGILAMAVLIVPFYTLYATRCTLSYAAEQKIAVSVNGVNISEAEVQRAVDNQIAGGIFHKTITQEKREQMRKSVIDALIDKELLYQEAKRIGLGVAKSEVKEVLKRDMAKFKSKKDFYKTLERQGLDEDSYKDLIEKELLIKKILKQEVEDKARLSEGDIEKYYNENKNKFVSPEKVKLREIFIKVPANATSEERKERKKRADDIRGKAVAGEDFAKLAKEFSEDDYKEKGGDTGYLHLNMLDEEVAKEIVKLRTNEISGIIEHLYGFYIFKMEDKQPERLLKFEEVKDRLMIELPLRKVKEMREALINSLKAKAIIKIFQ